MNGGQRFKVLDSRRGITLLRNSYLFVDFFFVLSGFGIWRFALLRFGRLYPLRFSLALR